MFKLFGKAIKATKIKNMLNFFVQDEQTDLFEGQTKQFGQDDQRQLKTGESGKKRWHNLTSEEQQDLFQVKPEQLDIFSGKEEEPKPAEKTKTEPEPKTETKEEPKDTRTLEEKLNDLLDEKQKNKTFKDVNDRVGGSKKEIVALKKLSLKNILKEADEATAFGLITKDKVIDDLTTEEIEERKEAGYASGAVYLQQKFRESIISKPKNSPEAREKYIEVLPKLIEKLDSFKTIKELKEYCDNSFEYSYDGHGHYEGWRYIKPKKIYRIKDKDVLSEGTEATEDKPDTFDYNDILGDRFFNLVFKRTDATKKTWIDASNFSAFTEERQREQYEQFKKEKEGLIRRTLARTDKADGELAWELEHNGAYYRVFYGTKRDLNNISKNNPKEYQRLLDAMKKAFYIKATNIQESIVPFEKWVQDNPQYQLTPDNWDWAGIRTNSKKGIKTGESTDIKINESIPLAYIKRTGGRVVLDNEVQAYKIIEEFDYKSLQLGNYVKDKEAKEHIRHYLGAMRDLEDVLGVDLKAVNQQGGLSLAIGARGSGNALAHYEPGHVIINLTKKKGDGSIAHEWFHFLDHFLGGQTLSTSRDTMYMSHKKDAKRYNRGYRTSSENKLERAFEELMYAINYGSGRGDNKIPKTYKPSTSTTYYPGVKKTYEDWQKRYAELEQKKEKLKNSNLDSDIKGMVEQEYKDMEGKTPAQKTIEAYLRYSNGDKVASYIAKLAGEPVTVMVNSYSSKFMSGAVSFKSDYWRRPLELCARAFESYIQDKLEEKGLVNNYLVAGNDSSKGEHKWASSNLERGYPQGEERKLINERFDSLFDALKKERPDFNKKNYQKDLQEYLSIAKGMDLGVDESVLIAKHREIIESAIKENKYIPNHVRADYPDLFTDGTKERANVFIDQQEDVKKAIAELLEKGIKIPKLTQFNLFDKQLDMFDEKAIEGSKKQFGENDERVLQTTQSGVKRWVNTDEEGINNHKEPEKQYGLSFENFRDLQADETDIKADGFEEIINDPAYKESYKGELKEYKGTIAKIRARANWLRTWDTEKHGDYSKRSMRQAYDRYLEETGYYEPEAKKPEKEKRETGIITKEILDKYKEITKLKNSMQKRRSNLRVPGEGGTRARTTTFNAKQGQDAELLNSYKNSLRDLMREALSNKVEIPKHIYDDLGYIADYNSEGNYDPIVKKSLWVRLFNKSFQIGKLPENYKSQFGEQTDMFPNMKGQERPNHKYIKREPDPNKPGKYIYYYQLPNGQVVGKDEEGKEVQSQQVEPQGDETTGQQEFPDQGNLDLFADIVGCAEDKKTGSEREELYRQEKEEETKNLFKLYGEMARQQIQEARLSMNFYFDKMKEFSSKHGFEEPDKNNTTFFVKTKDHLISEINENREKGVGRVTDGAFIHHYFGDGNTDAVIGEYQKDGYEVKPIQDEYVEPDFASYKFDKYIAEKGDERFEIWAMDKPMYQAYVDAQAKSSVRLKETKTSLALKLEAEKIPEFGMVKQRYMQRGKANKNLFVIGGLAGAGKTTVLGNTLQKSGVVIDPDSIKFDLGEIRGTDKEDIKSNPAKYHEESSVVAKHLLREMLREGKRTIFDGTMKSVPNVGDLTVLAKSAGYKTHAKFIHIPIEVGIERDRMRGERGGRSLGEGLYRKLYEGYPTHKSLFTLAPKFDNIDLYDNSREASKKAVKVYRKSMSGERILSRRRYEEIKKLGQIIKAILNFIRKSRFTK